MGVVVNVPCEPEWEEKERGPPLSDSLGSP